MTQKLLLILQKNSTHTVQTCIRIPFVYMIGPAKYDPNLGLVTSLNFSLYTCINNNYTHTFPLMKDGRVFILLKLELAYGFQLIYNDFGKKVQTLYVTEEILKNLKCVKHFLGLLIAAILGIIAITTAAAIAGTVLHKPIQTVHFVQEQHTDADVLWTTQQKIDGKVASQVADLKQSIILLGDQLVSLQKEVRLRCDWNYSSFCVTAFKYKTQLTEKETQMYRTDFWTLWEKARMGCFERTASKYIYYLG